LATSFSSPDQRRVIGFFACDGAHLLLDNEACIVTSTDKTLRRLLSQQSPRDSLGSLLDMRVRKIRLGAILQGLAGGGAYAFDAPAYAVFVPLAKQYGYALDAHVPDGNTDVEGDALVLHTVRG